LFAKSNTSTTLSKVQPMKLSPQQTLEIVQASIIEVAAEIAAEMQEGRCLMGTKTEDSHELVDYRQQEVPTCDRPADSWWAKMRARIDCWSFHNDSLIASIVVTLLSIHYGYWGITLSGPGGIVAGWLSVLTFFMGIFALYEWLAPYKEEK
jgi:hypothetical protein